MTEASEDRDRIIRLETQLVNLSDDVKDLKADLKEATAEWRTALQELKVALIQNKYIAAEGIQRPMDRFMGVKLALMGLGGIIVFVVTVMGGLLGTISFFRVHH
jgi:hypothetical protein